MKNKEIVQEQNYNGKNLKTKHFKAFDKMMVYGYVDGEREFQERISKKWSRPNYHEVLEASEKLMEKMKDKVVRDAGVYIPESDEEDKARSARDMDEDFNTFLPYWRANSDIVEDDTIGFIYGNEVKQGKPTNDDRKT